jgi:hypothetical protein
VQESSQSSDTTGSAQHDSDACSSKPEAQARGSGVTCAPDRLERYTKTPGELEATLARRLLMQPQKQCHKQGRSKPSCDTALEKKSRKADLSNKQKQSPAPQQRPKHRSPGKSKHHEQGVKQGHGNNLDNQRSQAGDTRQANFEFKTSYPMIDFGTRPGLWGVSMPAAASPQDKAFFREPCNMLASNIYPFQSMSTQLQGPFSVPYNQLSPQQQPCPNAFFMPTGGASAFSNFPHVQMPAPTLNQCGFQVPHYSYFAGYYGTASPFPATADPFHCFPQTLVQQPAGALYDMPNPTFPLMSSSSYFYHDPSTAQQEPFRESHSAPLHPPYFPTEPASPLYVSYSDAVAHNKVSLSQSFAHPGQLQTQE